MAADGSFAGRFAASDDALIRVPEDAEDVVAAAFGQVGLAAWMPLTWLAPVRPGEVVLVLGATGSVGSVAVQAAKLLGAGRVVAVGRDQSRLDAVGELGADAVVALDGDDFRDRLAAALDRRAARRSSSTLSGARRSRLPRLLPARERGSFTWASRRGPSRALASGLVRGKQLQILGYSNFAVPADALAKGYAEVVGHAAAGSLRLATDVLPLGRVGEAWERQSRGHDVKLVLVPEAL